jgi:hypothetical protein
VEKALALHASGQRELALDIMDQLTGAVGKSAMTQVRAVLAAAVIRPAGTGGTLC